MNVSSIRADAALLEKKILDRHVEAVRTGEHDLLPLIDEVVRHISAIRRIASDPRFPDL
jgi:hypothetical protein